MVLPSQPLRRTQVVCEGWGGARKMAPACVVAPTNGSANVPTTRTEMLSRLILISLPSIYCPYRPETYMNGRRTSFGSLAGPGNYIDVGASRATCRCWIPVAPHPGPDHLNRRKEGAIGQNQSERPPNAEYSIFYVGQTVRIDAVGFLRACVLSGECARSHRPLPSSRGLLK